MSYQHGIILQEEATALSPMTTVNAPTVALGTASKGTASTPILIHNMDEFTEMFGFTGDFDANTLEEVAATFFTLFNVRPVVFIRVDKSAGASAVTKNDVIAAIPIVEQIYPRLSMVPGNIIAPKWSAVPEVAIAMAAKARLINGIFRSFAVADIDLPTAFQSREDPTADKAVDDKAIVRGDLLGDDATSTTNYQLLNTYKTNNNLADEFLGVCWPRVGFGDKTYWLSTQAAALMNLVDAQRGQIPYESPSNKTIRADRSLVKDGTAIFLPYDVANTINGWGIVTAMNFNGWRLYGNRTSIYPTGDDPKDSFIACRRMMNWLCNTLAINYFSRIDNPINKRLIESIVDEINLFLSGLTSQGVLLGGRIEFNEDDNPKTALADGLIVFRIYVGLVTPARSITFKLAFDINYFSALFS